jgi:hypothetical protein
METFYLSPKVDLAITQQPRGPTGHLESTSFTHFTLKNINILCTDKHQYNLRSIILRCTIAKMLVHDVVQTDLMLFQV